MDYSKLKLLPWQVIVALGLVALILISGVVVSLIFSVNKIVEVKFTRISDHEANNKKLKFARIYRLLTALLMDVVILVMIFYALRDDKINPVGRSLLLIVVIGCLLYQLWWELLNFVDDVDYFFNVNNRHGDVEINGRRIARSEIECLKCPALRRQKEPLPIS
jgi:hypothetical protein